VPGLVPASGVGNAVPPLPPCSTGQKVPRVLGGFAPGGQPHSFHQPSRYRRFLP
jgi:hypothetical protein